MHVYRFPGETKAYRDARDELLRAEAALRDQVEAVAALRRALPVGAPPPVDYAFDDVATGAPVRLSELFGDKDSLVVYSYMFGPDAKAPCPMCTCFLDALDGNAQHIARRAALAVVAKSPAPRIAEIKKARGWKNLRLVSSAGNSFNRDYHGEETTGAQNSIIHTFVRRGGEVRHFYSSELEFIPAAEGQNQRHIDLMWPLWNVLDLTPEGRGKDWFPKLAY
jgi:predicted dithiol-disulfide oxidoreductase (DUF899 family)